MSRLVLLVIIVLQVTLLYSRGKEKDRSVAFVQPEFLIGKAIPSNSNFPSTLYQKNFSLSIGKLIHDPNRNWAVFLNYPTCGVTVSYTDYGSGVFGSSYSVVPFLSLKAGRKQFNSFQVKIGLGASYFTNYYHETQNRDNLAIGSPITWTFQTSVFYNVYVHKNIDLKLGVSFIHHSNGHTQMPNLGLNSVLFSLASALYIQPIDEQFRYAYSKPKLNPSKDYLISARLGIGIHEFGGPESETGGVKRAVNVFSFSASKLYKEVLKLSIGFSYRFYHQYYDYINNYKPSGYVENPTRNASNIVIYIGSEILMGHVGIDGEVGINVYKPFYAYHSELHENDSELMYFLKKTFATRLGLKFYLINTMKNPKNNVYIGSHINANLGQADFSELSLGYAYRFK